jgi:hypothetical protein
MAWNEETMKTMDEAALQAQAEVQNNFNAWSAKDIAEWWKRWYLKAGHKRLGRILVSMVKQEKTNTNDKE